ncbi:major facilitator superfamily domain-containing protein [Scheffersomyces xylosifermentans]|uniref:major facilitator superfamily domain-containing protein n=1 Tax=Scheffersomyces xylosifermentans TaxID=1304137 RepID=UPI00315CCBA2
MSRSVTSGDSREVKEALTETPTGNEVLGQDKSEKVAVVAAEDLLANPEQSIKQILKLYPVKSYCRSRDLLYIVVFGLYLYCTMNGYDGSLQTAIETLPEYKEYFNFRDSASDTGLVFSIFPAGAICATVFIWLGDYIGRMLTIMIGLSGTIVAAIIISCTNDHGTYIGGRFLLSFFSTIANCAAAMLLTESIPQDMRCIIATWTMYGTNKNLSGAQTFKIGLWLQFGDWPRYLYSKNKVEETRAFIVKFHANGDASHPIVDAEMEEIGYSFETNGFLKPKDYLNSALSSTQRIKNATTRLLLSGINSILSYIFATCGGLLIDRLPRRWVLLYANAGFVICFAALAGSVKAFDADPKNDTAASAGIAFLYIFMTVFFSFAFTPLQPIYPAEIINVASFVNLYSAPVAMENIKYWYYVLFVFWDAFQFLIIYFFFVETCALTLEEIEIIFNNDHTVKESKRMSKVARSHAHKESEDEIISS